MRLWSIHPSYLDRQGLLALWREGLLALAVLRGKTVGYKNHPQLDRFKALADPEVGLFFYLDGVAGEMERRGYKPNREKLSGLSYARIQKPPTTIEVTRGQCMFEIVHALKKVSNRSPEEVCRFAGVPYLGIETHWLFRMVDGDKLEDWERGA